MSHLNVHTGTIGVSPIPNRGLPMSLTARTGLIGGGMFAGGINHAPAESSLRSGARISEDEARAAKKRSGKSSSEEAEDRRKNLDGEDWGMAMDMEL